MQKIQAATSYLSLMKIRTLKD